MADATFKIAHVKRDSPLHPYNMFRCLFCSFEVDGGRRWVLQHVICDTVAHLQFNLAIWKLRRHFRLPTVRHAWVPRWSSPILLQSETETKNPLQSGSNIRTGTTLPSAEISVGARTRTLGKLHRTDADPSENLVPKSSIQNKEVEKRLQASDDHISEFHFR